MRQVAAAVGANDYPGVDKEVPSAFLKIGFVAIQEMHQSPGKSGVQRSCREKLQGDRFDVSSPIVLPTGEGASDHALRIEVRFWAAGIGSPASRGRYVDDFVFFDLELIFSNPRPRH